MDFRAEKTDGGAARIYIYGDIVADSGFKWSEDDVAPREIVDKLGVIGESDVDIFINSGGGNVFAGFAIYNAIKQLKGKKTVYIDGLAASIASVIAMAGDEIKVYGNSYMMIHRAWSSAAGNAAELRETADILERLDASILDIYKTRFNVSEDKLKVMIDAETWLDGSECAGMLGAVLMGEQSAAAYARSECCYKHKPEGMNDCADDEKAYRRLQAERLKIELGL